MLVLLIVSGVVLLVVVAVCIGSSMDTRAQRREWGRVARQRRLRRGAGARGTSPLCDTCPYRQPDV